MDQGPLPFLFSSNVNKAIRISFREYEVYHDESAEKDYWHGMLMIPCEQKEKFYQKMLEERKKLDYFNSFSFKEITSSIGQKMWLADSWLSYAIGFMRSKLNKERYHAISWLKTERKFEAEILPNNYLGAKFILSRVIDGHKKMTYYIDPVSNIETTIRMAIKGGLHFLGNPDNPIHIERIHFDGHEQYQRNLSQGRIVNRMLEDLRNYCSFSKREDLIDDRSSKPDSSEHQDTIDCDFLILTDLLIGSFRTALSKAKKGDKRKRLSRHARLILDRFMEGSTRMKNSRWANSFCLSESQLVNGRWEFSSLIPEDDKKKNSYQTRLQ